jgi:hypothetical protein
MKLEVVDGIGENIGLSELEVYYDSATRPEAKRTKNFTDFVSYVDPTIETGRGRWFFCTPGSRPFGEGRCRIASVIAAGSHRDEVGSTKMMRRVYWFGASF